jgi:cytochrome c oxidase assembly factor CtaG
MKIVTGFIYYFLIIVLAITFSLVVFAFKPLRRLLHRVQSRYRNILSNPIVNVIVYFSFAVIGVILIESIYTFCKIHRHLYSCTFRLI